MGVLVLKPLNIRKDKPSVNAECIGYYEPGVYITLLDKVAGDKIEGNNTWYKVTDNQYIWSGGLDLTVTVPATKPGFKNKFSEKAKDSSLYGWNISSLAINTIWEETLFGDGIKIAVLDSGAKLDHPDLSVKVENRWSVLNKDHDCTDENGHGTHCAGVIGGQGQQLLGVAPAAELMIVKIRRFDMDQTLEGVINGIEWAAEKGANIISMSLVFDDDFPGLEKLQQVIQKYSDKVIFVAAAGNLGALKKPEEIHQYPASFPECISVGALGVDGNRYYRSNKSRYLTLVAPGENIRSTYTAPAYIEFSDTSFAVPLVSGIIALLMSYVRKNKIPLSNQMMLDIIKHTCDDKNNDGKDYQYGFGIINPVKALNKIKNYSIL